VNLGEGISLVCWTAEERVVGRTLSQTEHRSRWGLHVVAVRRKRPDGEESVTVMQEANFIPLAGDILLLVGAHARLKAFTR
jgi:uncharacterized protein with PhoU and TrkA domain